MDTTASHLTPEQQVIQALLELFGHAVRLHPSKRCAQMALGLLRTDVPEVDREVRSLAGVIYLLALACPALLAQRN
jgi:hypothetical protein